MKKNYIIDENTMMINDCKGHIKLFYNREDFESYIKYLKYGLSITSTLVEHYNNMDVYYIKYNNGAELFMIFDKCKSEYVPMSVKVNHKRFTSNRLMQKYVNLAKQKII